MTGKSVAVHQPDLMHITTSLLEHASSHTGKHYNQARTLDAGRRNGETISELREGFLDPKAQKVSPSSG